MKHYLSIFLFVLCTLSKSFAQEVIIFEDFEAGAPGWSKSTPHTNEWYLLAMNSSLTSGSGAVAVSNDGTNNAYSNGGTGSSVWVSPGWPATITTDVVKIQFDFRVAGSAADNMSVYLVDLDPLATVPTPANLNGTNSVGLATALNGFSNWTRATITLSAANKSFIAGSTNNTLLVFTWENNNLFTTQPPAAIDNVIVTASPSTPSPLAGDYYIGRTGTTDFPSITSALDYLNTNGLSADVNFYLVDETYTTDFETFPLEIGDGTTTPFTGMGTYSITFKPDPATTPTPTITKSSNTFTANVDNRGVFTLWGVSNIIFDGSNTVGGSSRDLTIIDDLAGSASNAPIGIYLGGLNETDAIGNIQINNLNLSTSDQTYGYGILAGLYVNLVTGHFSDEAVFNNISIENNSISKVREAIHIDASDRDGIGGFNSTSYATNVDIISNDLQSTGTDAIQERGIHLLGVNGGSISQNTIGNFDQTDLNSDVGIVLDQATQNLIVERNEIFNLGFDGNTTSSLSAHGMDIYSGLVGSGITIKNNVIRNISGNGASSTANAGYFNPAAIFMGLGGEVGQLQTYTQSGFDIYNNSIYLFGAEMDFITSVSMGLAVADNTSDVDFRNNIVKNTLGGATTLGGSASAMAVFAQTNATQFTDLNYNAYHIDANTTYTNNFIGLIGSLADLLTDADTDMSSWRTTTNDEASSLHAAPGYTSTTNLLPDNTNSNSWNVHGMGQPITGVDNDFTGASRPTTVAAGAPDLGAYEFTQNPMTLAPSKVTQNGPLATSTVYTFSIGERNWVEIEFNPGSDLPDDISVQLISGIWPGNQMTFNIYNYYIDITATENANTNYDYNLKMYYDESYIGNVPSESEATLELTHDADYTGVWMGRATTINVTENSMTANNLSSFGKFTGTSDSSPLPVEWVSIEANESGDVNIIKWVTATEINSESFVVERSRNVKDWVEIGEVSAAGNSSSINKYRLIDHEPWQYSYYRIKQYDLDGTRHLSEIYTVAREFDENNVSIFPNPFKNNMVIRNLPKNEVVNIELKSILGRQVYSQKRDVTDDLIINLPEIEDGVYFMILTFGDQSVLRKVIKSSTQNSSLIQDF